MGKRSHKTGRDDMSPNMHQKHASKPKLSFLYLFFLGEIAMGEQISLLHGEMLQSYKEHIHFTKVSLLFPFLEPPTNVFHTQVSSHGNSIV